MNRRCSRFSGSTRRADRRIPRAPAAPRARDLSRGACDSVPRRRSRLLRLPILRSHLCDGRVDRPGDSPAAVDDAGPQSRPVRRHRSPDPRADRSRPADGTVLADLFFWKSWLARRFTTPECEPVCCDANIPLPFAREAFSLVVLSDAFPYIWHKRLVAEEMMPTLDRRRRGRDAASSQRAGRELHRGEHPHAGGVPRPVRATSTAVVQR